MGKYCTALFLFFAAPYLASSQKPKPDKFLPPIESHGMSISGYGCDRQHVADSTSTSKDSSYWTLIVWAQYGDKHKKYWQKSYDNYEIPVKHSVSSSGESAGSGAAIGAFGSESYDFTTLDKACAEWGTRVKSSLKIDPNGEKSKE